VKLFGLRLDKIESALTIGNTAIVERETVKLRKQIAELPQTSVVIKEAASVLHCLEEENFWLSLSSQKIEYLRNQVKPLFRTVSDADFKAMRFERDILETSLAKLRDQQERYYTLNDAIVEQITELPLSVGFVKHEEELIRAAQTNHFWNKATEETFDELIAKLSPLMKFREQESGAIGQVHLNLADLIHNKEMVEFGPQQEAVSITRYREMVETLITGLTKQNPILSKIKDGQEISPEEATELAVLLPKHRYIDGCLVVFLTQLDVIPCMIVKFTKFCPITSAVRT